MGITGIHHIAVYTDNLERSLAFYTAIGGEVVHSFAASSNGKMIVLVSLAPGAVFEIIQKSAPRTAGSFPHVALETDNCDKTFALLVSAGATVQSAPRDMALGTMNVRNAFVFGPDNEIIEIMEVKKQ